MQILRKFPNTDLCRPWNVSSVRKLPEPGSVEPDGAILPLACLRVRRMFPGPVGRVRPSGGDLHGVRLLFLLLGHLAFPRQMLRRQGDGTVRINTGKLRGRIGEQRWIPPPVFRAEGNPCVGCGACRECGGGCGIQGGPDDGEILRCSDGEGNGVKRPAGGVSPPGAAHRGEPVRHHIPRALFLLFLRDGRADLRRTRSGPLRRGGDPDPWGLAQDLRPACR